jgi:hypothetical protein
MRADTLMLLIHKSLLPTLPFLSGRQNTATPHDVVALPVSRLIMKRNENCVLFSVELTLLLLLLLLLLLVLVLLLVLLNRLNRDLTKLKSDLQFLKIGALKFP